MDDDVFSPPNILRLVGVTWRDYVAVEDVADSKFSERQGDDTAPMGESPAVPEPPGKIPSTFTGLEDWPTATNLRCWMCGFTFDGSPKFVPRYVRESDTGGVEFGVIGNMCTFNCAELWIETVIGGRASAEERWRYQNNLCLAYLMFTGRRVTHIKPAPMRTELADYGGELDEKAFWARLRELDPQHGLRDHTPGTVVPERDRAHNVLMSLRAKADPAPPSTLREIVNGAAGRSLWRFDDSVPIDGDDAADKRSGDAALRQNRAAPNFPPAGESPKPTLPKLTTYSAKTAVSPASPTGRPNTAATSATPVATKITPAAASKTTPAASKTTPAAASASPAAATKTTARGKPKTNGGRAAAPKTAPEPAAPEPAVAAEPAVVDSSAIDEILALM